MRKMKILIIIPLIFGVLLILGSALLTIKGYDVKICYTENNFGNEMNASFLYFNGTDSKKLNCHKGDKVTINYSVKQEMGKLNFVVEDETGKIMYNKSQGHGKVTFIASSTQTYTINVMAEKAKGSYKIAWN